jgi:hypothetical protein
MKVRRRSIPGQKILAQKYKIHLFALDFLPWNGAAMPLSELAGAEA